MATETRSTAAVAVPEVDVLAGISIDRLAGRVVMSFQPAVRVMEADGVTQATNPLGQPLHERADAAAYSIYTDLTTPERVERIVALESGALARIVAATLTAAGNTFDAQTVEDITTQLLGSDQGLDAAMTAEAEALRAELLVRWDEMVAAGQADVPALGAEFGVGVGVMPGETGPFTT